VSFGFRYWLLLGSQDSVTALVIDSLLESTACKEKDPGVPWCLAQPSPAILDSRIMIWSEILLDES
jgi:hypothetical protein